MDALPVIDHTKQALWTTPSTFKADPVKYAATWEAKVKAYNDALNAGLPKEHYAPADLLPEDLDVGHFDATAIPPKVLDPDTLKITEMTATDIVAAVAEKKLSAVMVMTAFIKRATLAHQLTHCAMDVFFGDALARAKELDEYQAKTGKTIGPLHGLPISLKEHFDFANRITHRGYVSLLTNIPSKHSVVTQILQDAGALLYIRTTMPQSLMHPDSVNYITGRGRNAHKTSMSPGGSSSGEGALIAMKGSVLGVGGDIGGSVRFPAAFNGIWGLKPTTKRISGKGIGGSADTTTNEGIIATLGPMANNPDDLELLMKTYTAAEPWTMDQSVVPIPWRDVPVPAAKDLTIALVYDDGVVKPHPPNIRAMKECEAKLKAAGVNVITWEPHRVYEAISVVNGLFTADGNLAAKLKLAESGEPLAPLTEYFLQVGTGDKGLTTLEYMSYVKEREVLRQQYLDLFNSRGVDFILTPTYVGVAPKPSTPKYWGYTSLWNLMDASCVTFPTGMTVDKTIDVKDETYKPRNEYEEYEYGLYDAEYADGLPIGFTVVGRRFTEEKCLQCAKVLAKIINP